MSPTKPLSQTSPFTKPTKEPTTSPKPNNHQNPHPKDRLSDILSDSDISILDLGPSLSSRNSSCYHLSTENASTIRPKDIPDFLRTDSTTNEEQKTRIAFSLSNLSNSSLLKDTAVDGVGGGDITPKKNKPRVGSMRAKLRTISTPLLSPLRGGSGGRVGRPGVLRAKTSFRGVGGVLEN
ncbi:hypothetical protein BDV29DRAFT_164783 [Aspergillus leporis]|jgi:hypothetical protein|uniref:Uncharacterized protein n=1 Tax=Aspergillus leporis TaxID=41062 RepID=A0A5N5XEZ6_9EURO|nr:hypothetical protein BDV29DRAFT_164783 [Aspergillus leporis]